MKCGLCHQDVDKLSKSHIIPRALHLLGEAKGNHQGLLVFSAEASEPVKRSHAGFYSRIVCAACEDSFKAGDDALIDVSRVHAHAAPIKDRSGNTDVVVFTNVDNATLHRGVITTLFRAHLSDNKFYKGVHLPPKFAEPLRRLLLSDEPTHVSTFDTVLHVTPTLYGRAIRSPERLRVEYINTYWLTFPYWTAIVKVDGQKALPFHQMRIGAYAHPVATLMPPLSPAEIEAFWKTMHGRKPEVSRITGMKFEQEK